MDLYVEDADGRVWHPWHGPLCQPYRFRYREDREYRLHAAATGLLYRQVLDGRILDWLCRYPTLWSALVFVLAGQYEHAGALGDLVRQADQASVAQALGGDPSRVATAPKHALQRKLLDGLRYLLNTELKLNQPGPSDGWLTEDALWLVSKTVSDKLRAHLLALGIDGIPASNTAVFDVLQDHGMLLPTPDGKAVWRATIASRQGWSHPFTLLKLAPSLIWADGEWPAPFDGSVNEESGRGENAGVAVASAEAARVSPPSPAATPSVAPLGRPRPDDALASLLDLIAAPVAPPAAHAPLQAAADADADADADVDSEAGADFDTEAGAPAAAHVAPSRTASHEAPGQPAQADFVTWLGQALRARKLILNDAKALVHTVDDTLFLVSPSIFQRFVQEHPQVARDAGRAQLGLAPWQWVQKRFEKQQFHRKQPNGLNIWTCEVSGPRKTRRLHGYLLADPASVIDNCPPNNPYLGLDRGSA